MIWLSHISDNVKITIGGIFGLLIFSHIVVFILQQRHPNKDFSNIKLRLKSWWVVILMISVLNFIGGNAVIWFWAFISFLALKEFFTMVPTRRADRRVLFWAYLSIPLQYYWISIGWYTMFLVFVPVYVFFLLPTRMLIIGETKGFLQASSTLHWAVMMMVYAMSHIAYFYTLPPAYNLAGGRAGLAIYLLFLTQFNDAAQYVWGKSLGRHKVIPKVSPNKTVEGFVGGVLTTVLVSAFLGPFLTPMGTYASIVAGFIIGVSGFLGDVTISAVKRDIQVKDSGNLLPGHGGILDRLDSLTFTAPLFFHFFRYYFY